MRKKTKQFYIYLYDINNYLYRFIEALFIDLIPAYLSMLKDLKSRFYF